MYRPKHRLESVGLHDRRAKSSRATGATLPVPALLLTLDLEEPRRVRVKPNHLPTPPQGEKLPECLVSDNDRTGAFFLKCNEASGHLFPCCKHRLHAPARAAPERAMSDTDTLPHLPPALRGRGPLAAWTAAWRSGGRTHAPGWPPAYHSSVDTRRRGSRSGPARGRGAHLRWLCPGL